MLSRKRLTVSDDPKRWPNFMAYLRENAAEAAVRGGNALRPIISGEASMNETERLRREAIAMVAFQDIIRFLEAAGAQTRP